MPRGPKDGRPDLHRRLAWYHFRKWLAPAASIPIPSDMSLCIQPPNPEPGGFLDPLFLVTHSVPLKDRPFELTRAFRYHSPVLGRILIVPAGYRSDFASIPRLFWRILPPVGRYSHAAVVHDYLCDLRGATGINSATTHRVFLEAMSVLQVPAWKRHVMYKAVRWFGPRFPSDLSDQSDRSDQSDLL